MQRDEKKFNVVCASESLQTLVLIHDNILTALIWIINRSRLDSSHFKKYDRSKFLKIELDPLERTHA